MQAADHIAWHPLMKVKDARAGLARAAEIWDRYRNGPGQAFDYVPTVSATEPRLEYRLSLEPLEDAPELERMLRYSAQDARSALDNTLYALGETAGASPKQLRNNQFPNKLQGLHDEHASRVRTAVQHLAQPNQWTHPVDYLRLLSNADKHHLGLRVGLVPSLPGGESHLATVRMEIPEALIEAYMDGGLFDPDNLSLVNGPVFDGDVVFSMPLPDRSDCVEVDAGQLDLPLDLVLFSAADPEPTLCPALPTLANAVRFTDHAIRYVTGVVQDPPEPFSPDFFSSSLKEILGE